MRIGDAFADLAFTIAMETTGRWSRDRLLAAANEPAATQARTLRRILRACRDTELGQLYRFGSIDSVETFRAAVPICDYESLRSFIDRQIATGSFSIAPERPLMYARTSGTTGAPKYIPVTRGVLRRLRRAQRAMAYVQHEALDAFSGRIIGIGGARCEERLSDGTPAGATTGLIYETMPRFIRAKYVVPPAIFGIDDYHLKYAIIARLAVQAGDVTAIATANPSTILRLMDVVRRDLVGIVEAIEAGDVGGLKSVPPTLLGQIAPSLAADSMRADALRPLLRSAASITIADLWPDLRAVVTWLGGGCVLAADAVRRELPPSARLVDAGYVASEMRGTIVVDVARGLALPLLDDVFFECVPADAWEAGRRETILLHELEEGRDYHVIITSEAGLFRYHMNDVVRATEPIRSTPTLSFVRKGRGVTNITGEKLSEDQVHLAVTRTIRTCGSRATFFVVLADPLLPGYRAFIEFLDTSADCNAFASALDRELCRLNIEYGSKRQSGRLRAIDLAALKAGTAEAYHRHCVRKKGQREAQLKVLALQTVDECDFEFESHVVANAPLASRHL